jgi:hypothetical protein
MENLLNIAWLVLSLAAGWLWLRRWRDVSRYSFPLQLATLTCVLIILFPVVSANDDLYLQQIAIEASENQKKSSAEVSSKLVRQAGPVGTGFLALLPTPPALRFDADLTMAADLPPQVLLERIFSFSLLNRPPPHLFLA